MGSRYGGLKQIDPVGSHGEAILDYSLYDAYQAGFKTAVIIIKEAIRQDFMDTVGKRLKKCPMEIRYAYQELDKLPEFEKRLYEYMDVSGYDVLTAIRTTGKLEKETEEGLKKALAAVKAEFTKVTE